MNKPGLALAVLVLWVMPVSLLADHVLDHERLQRTRWVGMQKYQLIRILGAPLKELDIPGPTGVDAYVLQYPKSKIMNGPVCIDSFKISKKTERVLDFFCR
ncbi:MAG: hypothetical protein COW30_11785 [Rhodospirillales bacterium CG15_BIG_FIL_POST_REV_8_21_14_020_66_15]|nr:MAG: hypothetical protein COW30_11785 [Rhodospirillales bacterium CG15_BIG_FIL_POST_REV_8_21_14_020_66_15]